MSFCSGLPLHSFASLSFHMGLLVLRPLSLSLSLLIFLSGSLSSIGITATGLPLRLGSQLFVVFFRLLHFRFLSSGWGGVVGVGDSALFSSSFRSVYFSFTVLCGVFSCFFFLPVSFVSFPSVLSFFAVLKVLVLVVPCRRSCRDCRLSLSLVFFLVVC